MKWSESHGESYPGAPRGAELHGVGVHGPAGLQRRGAHRPGSAPGGHRPLGEAPKFSHSWSSEL